MPLTKLTAAGHCLDLFRSDHTVFKYLYSLMSFELVKPVKTPFENVGGKIRYLHSLASITRFLFRFISQEAANAPFLVLNLSIVSVYLSQHTTFSYPTFTHHRM